MSVDYYEKFRNEALLSIGFVPDELTDEQKDVILEPSEAPENYACDGEISPREAKVRWKQNLIRSGLNEEQVSQAIKKVLG